MMLLQASMLLFDVSVSGVGSQDTVDKNIVDVVVKRADVDVAAVVFVVGVDAAVVVFIDVALVVVACPRCLELIITDLAFASKDKTIYFFTSLVLTP